jgi:isopentenyl phosphate kinase
MTETTRDLWVLKLGGGAVTRKDANRREARPDVIRSAARQIRRARQERALTLVVVHGAGPFGHSLVADYGINAGVRGPRQVEGFVRTHNSMEDLDKIVMDIFREEGLLGFPLQPSACVIQRDRRIDSFFTAPVEHLLALDPDIIPILYGDMVVDRSLGASVVSGDALVAHLAGHLGARRVLLGTDVAGVFTADPRRDPSARRIDRIDRENLAEVLASLGGSAGVDVTGGMRGKVQQLVEALAGVPALIFDLTGPDALYRALTGRELEGTEICT